MKSCSDIQELLPEFDDGDLGEVELQAVAEHLGQCADCSRVLDEMRASWDMLGEWDDLQPDPGFGARFWERVGREEERQRFSLRRLFGERVWYPAAAVAVLACAFLGGIWVGGPAVGTSTVTVNDVAQETPVVARGSLAQYEVSGSGVLSVPGKDGMPGYYLPEDEILSPELLEEALDGVPR